MYSSSHISAYLWSCYLCSETTKMSEDSLLTWVTWNLDHITSTTIYTRPEFIQRCSQTSTSLSHSLPIDSTVVLSEESSRQSEPLSHKTCSTHLSIEGNAALMFVHPSQSVPVFHSSQLSMVNCSTKLISTHPSPLLFLSS